jgi:SAM-dependent methyltransferase
MTRFARLLLVCLIGALVTGGLATLLVLLRPDTLQAPASKRLLVAGVVVVGLNLAALFVRFTRWQFVLRRLDVRVPAVESLAAFVASFALLPVPLLLGQLVARRRLLPEGLRPSVSTNVLAFVWERLLDLWALLLLSIAVAPGALRWGAIALVLAGLVPEFRRMVLRACLSFLASAYRLLSPRPLRVETEQINRLVSGEVLVVGLVGSVVAWSLVASGLFVLSAALGLGQPVWSQVGAAAASILLGGLSLLPLGVAVSGLLLLDTFDALGVPKHQAVQIVFVFRVATVWFSVALGGVVLVLSRRYRALVPPASHFDAIDDSYDSWLPPHYRDHVVEKKVELMRPHLKQLGVAPSGLDIGCGRGWYLRGVQDAGARVVGVDLSRRQLAAAAEYAGEDSRLSQASITSLPFAAGTYDFAYTVNVVHHLESREAQRQAFREIARTLRPGGLVFLHEMNIRNPLFRAYLSYVFPLLKGIDEGIEHFLDPRKLPLPPELELASVDYFTFVPDLSPEPLLPLLSALERRLEKSPLAPLGAHFLATLRRLPG